MSADIAARARTLSPEALAARNEAISKGQKRGHARRKLAAEGVHIAREHIPNLPAQVKAIVVILEAEADDER